jgi:hypothetical protein
MALTEQGEVYTPDRRVTPNLVALAGCVGQKLEESGIFTCWGGVVSGDGLDLSEIGTDGAAWWVRLANLTVAAPGGQGNGTVTCKPVMLANVGVGYATCYPIDEEGKALSPEQQLHLSDLVHAAMMALYRGMACCDWHQGDTGLGQVTVVTWTPQGPAGGVLGGEWLLQFEILSNRPEPESL